MDFIGFSQLNLAYFLLFFSVNSQLNLGLFFCEGSPKDPTEPNDLHWAPINLTDPYEAAMRPNDAYWAQITSI